MHMWNMQRTKNKNTKVFIWNNCNCICTLDKIKYRPRVIMQQEDNGTSLKWWKYHINLDFYRGSGAGTLGVPLGGTRRVGGLLGVAGRLSGTVSPFRAEQGTSLETPWRAGPHLAKRWEPRGFSRVAAGFSSYAAFFLSGSYEGLSLFLMF